MSRPSPTVARAERVALADALLLAGPDAPTLCRGWTALDLAAHVVVRERRVDSLPGLAGGPLAAWTESVRHGATRRGLPDLAAAIRSGPPGWSPFALPGVDARGNELEMLVHHEDVRRGAGAGPRTSGTGLDEVDEAAWASLTAALGRLKFARAGVGVVLRRLSRGTDPGSPQATALTTAVVHRARGRAGTVTLSGAAVELVLYACGRRATARVALSGPDEAVHRLSTLDLTM